MDANITPPPPEDPRLAIIIQAHRDAGALIQSCIPQVLRLLAPFHNADDEKTNAALMQAFTAAYLTGCEATAINLRLQEIGTERKFRAELDRLQNAAKAGLQTLQFVEGGEDKANE